MKKNDPRYENYEDAKIALLMERLAEAEGKRLLTENERLRHEPAAQVPEAVDQRLREAICHAVAENHRRVRRRGVRLTLKRAAVATLMAALLLNAAYNVFPEVRFRVLETLDGCFDKLSEPRQPARNVHADTLMGYTLPEPPDGFTTTIREETGHRFFTEYKGQAEESIRILIEKTDEAYFDTRDASSVETMKINGQFAVAIEKEQTITIAQCDADNSSMISLVCTALDKADALSCASAILYVGQ